MKKELWFPTPIWFGQIEFDREKIKKACYKLKEKDPEGRIVSNCEGWQSKDILNEPTFKSFLKILNNSCKEIYRDISPNFDGVIDAAWVNINGPNGYNKLHYHSRCSLSGCVYINVDENSGEIFFHNPTLQEHYPINVSENPIFFQTVVYTPLNKRLLIFPAWIMHETSTSPNAKEDRISISFNITQKGFYSA